MKPTALLALISELYEAASLANERAERAEAELEKLRNQ